MHILLMKIEKLMLQSLRTNSTLLKKMRKKDDASELLDILKNNDALREQLKKMLSL